MQKFMELPTTVVEELKRNEQLLVKGGAFHQEEVQPNNSSGTCTGPNNGSGKCG